MTIKELQALKLYLKVSNLASGIEGVNKHTLLSKLRRGTELTIVESRKLEDRLGEVMEKGGFEVKRPKRLEAHVSSASRQPLGTDLEPGTTGVKFKPPDAQEATA